MAFLYAVTFDGRVLPLRKDEAAYFFSNRQRGKTTKLFDTLYEEAEILILATGHWFRGSVEIQPNAHPERVPDSTSYPTVQPRRPPAPPPPVNAPDRARPCAFMSTSERTVHLFKALGVFQEIPSPEALDWLFTHLGHVPTRAEYAFHRPLSADGPEQDTMKTPTDDGFITLKEAAAFTALSEGYLSKLSNNGAIESNGIQGRGLRLSAASVARFMAQRNKDV